MLKIWLLGFFSLLNIATVLAQVACYSTFSVSDTLGCAPLSITVKSHVSNENPIYNYADGTINSSPFHTYTKGGVYKMARIISPSCAASVADTITIVVVDQKAPELAAVACQGQQVRLTNNDELFSEVSLDWGDGAIGTVAKGGTAFHTYSQLNAVSIQATGLLADGTACGQTSLEFTPLAGLDKGKILSLAYDAKDSLHIAWKAENPYPYQRFLQEKQADGSFANVQSIDNEGNIALFGRDAITAQCYRLAVLEPCSGDTLYTEPICTVPFLAEALPGYNRFSWQRTASVQQMMVLKNADTLANLRLPLPDTIGDAAVFCGEDYCYKAIFALADGTTVEMPTQCVEALNSGKSIETLHWASNVSGDSLTFTWAYTGSRIASATLLYSKNGNAKEITLDSAIAFYREKGNWAKDTLCLGIQLADSCGNAYVSATYCNLLLSGRKKGDDSEFSWTSFAGAAPVGYVLEKYDKDGNLLTTYDVQGGSFVEEMEAISEKHNFYRVCAQPLAGGPKSCSNLVKVSEIVDIAAPEAFTPNADNLNDTFPLWGKRISDFSVKIYNRLGVLVYDSSASGGERWDGNFQGSPAQAGAYTYHATGTDVFGEPYQKKGIFILIRP